MKLVPTTAAAPVVNKHVGAIHIKNDISLLQRKVYNVLLSNAYAELGNPQVLVHSMSVRELAELAGFNSKNVGYLKSALEEMVTKKLNWNIVDESGKSEWGVSTALASAVIKDGMCSYAYSPHLREKLHNPKYYAPLNILIQSSFSSGHALALYENCVRYVGVRQTPVFSLELFRDLMGVGDNASYDDFKVLNKAVIKPAMKEVNTISDITVDVEMRKENRRVVGLKFTIASNPQGALAIEAPHTFNNELVARLSEFFCLTDKQAKDVLVTHSEERILAVMKYVEDRYTQGKVKQGKIAPYFLKVVKDGDIAPQESAFDRAKQDASKSKKANVDAGEARDRVRAELVTERYAAVRAYWDGLSEAEREQENGEFAQVLLQNPLLHAMWKKNGTKSKAVETEFCNFLAAKFLPDFDIAFATRCQELSISAA